MKNTILIISCTLILSGCVTSIITAPVKVAYGATKMVAKGTYKAVDFFIPDSDKKEKKKMKTYVSIFILISSSI